jgi:hypothetical protein
VVEPSLLVATSFHFVAVGLGLAVVTEVEQTAEMLGSMGHWMD